MRHTAQRIYRTPLAPLDKNQAGLSRMTVTQYPQTATIPPHESRALTVKDTKRADQHP